MIKIDVLEKDWDENSLEELINTKEEVIVVIGEEETNKFNYDEISKKVINYQNNLLNILIKKATPETPKEFFERIAAFQISKEEIERIKEIVKQNK